MFIQPATSVTVTKMTGVEILYCFHPIKLEKSSSFITEMRLRLIIFFGLFLFLSVKAQEFHSVHYEEWKNHRHLSRHECLFDRADQVIIPFAEKKPDH